MMVQLGGNGDKMNKLFKNTGILILLVISIVLLSHLGSQAFIFGKSSVEYIIDSSETDQGATGNGKTIKAYVDAIGTPKKATIKATHSSTGNETAYTLTTSETIPSNITLEIENGAVIDGAGTLTTSSPENIKAGKCYL